MNLTIFKFKWTCINKRIKVEFLEVLVQFGTNLYHFVSKFQTILKNNVKHKSYKDLTIFKIEKSANRQKNLKKS